MLSFERYQSTSLRTVAVAFATLLLVAACSDTGSRPPLVPSDDPHIIVEPPAADDEGLSDLEREVLNDQELRRLDRETHSALREAVSAVRAAAHLATEGTAYPGPGTEDLVAELSDTNPEMAFQAGISDGATVVSVNRVSDDTVVLAALAETGSCWFVKSSLQDGSTFAVDSDGDLSCDANLDAASVSGPSLSDVVTGEAFSAPSEVDAP